MERPNRFKGFICSDIGAGIGECAEDGFRLSLTPCLIFWPVYPAGKDVGVPTSGTTKEK